MRNTSNWWALVPSGVMAVIGLAFQIAGAVPIVMVIVRKWCVFLNRSFYCAILFILAFYYSQKVNKIKPT